MRRILLALVAALGLLLRPAVMAQWATNPAWTVFTPANDVSFTISTVRPRYGMTDPVMLTYEIVNLSNKPLYVPRTWTGTCPQTTHLMAWLEDSTGRHSVFGFGSSCSSGPGGPPPESLTERMKKDAVLLKPGERFTGAWSIAHATLPAGDYRVEAVFYGWKPETFSDADIAELAKLGAPFLRGEVPTWAKVTLTR